MGIFAVPIVSAQPAHSPPVPELPPVGPSVFRQPVIVGWSAGETPSAPPEFRVERFADSLDSPRWPYVLPNGDVLVAQASTEQVSGFPPELLEKLKRQGSFKPSANSILLLRPTDAGVERYTFIEGLSQPFGMILLGDKLYVANTDSLVRFAYREGATRVEQAPEKLLDIPAGDQAGNWNNHWTRNLAVRPDGRKLYLSVGAATDVSAEGIAPAERAAVWEINPDGSGKRLYATGLRNPTGMAFDPWSGSLWATVNERDGLGEDVPPDYLTRVVDGAFYGWPYVYFGSYPDPTQVKLNPGKVEQARQSARVPDLALGGHAVPLGLLFYRGKAFPDRYREGAFVARRGGVGRARFLGFDVVFVPFADGAPTGEIEPFLGGFIQDYDKGTVRGRPVGLAEMQDGSLLVTDDGANIIWRIRAADKTISDRF